MKKKRLKQTCENTDLLLKAHLYVTYGDRASFGNSYRYRCRAICGGLAPSAREVVSHQNEDLPYFFFNPPPPRDWLIFAAAILFMMIAQQGR
ncbi:MAG: hypothetical protein LUC98_02915 [Lachnospiraceae bacterium]|nr:hypothetical protein [Lachnospiraceae bacterium]